MVRATSTESGVKRAKPPARRCGLRCHSVIVDTFAHAEHLPGRKVLGDNRAGILAVQPTYSG